MKIRNFLIKITSTFFYLGYVPFIPGTAGSIGGVFLFYLLAGDLFKYGLFTFLILMLGFLVSGEAERIFQHKDSRCIVIDEVSGMLLSLIFIPPDIKWVIAGFIIFRILDSLKPYPASKFQRLKGSLGVMSDDIVAALYTGVILQVVLRFTAFKA
jgi:phosphatidylglycerophosphatase A